MQLCLWDVLFEERVVLKAWICREGLSYSDNRNKLGAQGGRLCGSLPSRVMPLSPGARRTRSRAEPHTLQGWLRGCSGQSEELKYEIRGSF